MRFRSMVVAVLAVVVVASALYLRRRPLPRVEVPETEGAVAPAPLDPRPLSSPSPIRIAAPALREVQPTLDRVFDQAVVMDAAIRTPFVAGDFDGDDVADLAVAVRPRSEAARSEINSGRPDWIVQDAAAQDSATGKPEPVKVTARDLLLAVVPGAAAGGWRNPDLRRGYLVRNAAGSSLTARPLAELPDAIRMRTYRVHTGDVVVSNRGGQPGVVLWTAAAYIWVDLQR
jgi:hypothetical protein